MPVLKKPKKIEAGEIPTTVSEDSKLKQWIPVAATGEFPQGDLTESIFDEIVSNFDPANHEPPVTLGHITKEHNSAPAFAWIDGVKRVGNMLYAKAKQVSQELDDLLKSGRFKKRSVGLRVKDDGTHYLHHLAFLGATAPAVKGLPDVYTEIFYEMTGDGFSVESNNEEIENLNINRKGQDMDKIYTEAELKAASDAAAAKAAAEAKTAAEKDFAEKAKKETDAAVAAATAAERAKVEKEFSDKSAATSRTIAHRADVDKFIDESIKSGNLVPAQVASARALLYAAEAKPELVYSEGEGESKKEIKTDSFAALKNIISNFGETTEGEIEDTVNGSDRGGDEKAYSEEKELVKEEMKKNPSMTYGQALKVVRAKK